MGNPGSNASASIGCRVVPGKLAHRDRILAFAHADAARGKTAG